MRNATVRQLRVFESVARNLSFSRAALEMHLSQPAVSTQIKLLEDHAGLPLFEHLGKKIFLTAAGRELLHYSRVILEQLREADDALAGLKGIKGGRLRIAAISAGNYFLPRLLAEFRQCHDEFSVQLAVTNREDVLDLLAQNQTDLAIMGRPPQTPEILSCAFAPHPYVIVAAPDHPLAQERRIGVEALNAVDFVVRERGSDTHIAMTDTFASLGIAPRIVLEIRNNEAVKQAVSAGMGVSFLSLHTMALELQAGDLVVLDVKGFPVERQWYVVHRKDKFLPPVARAFKDYVLEKGAGSIDAIIRRSRDVPVSSRRKQKR